MNIGINASALSAQKGGASFYILNIVKALAQTDTDNRYFIFTTKAAKNQFSGLPPNFKIVPCAPLKTVFRLLWEQSFLPFIICRKFKIQVLFSPNYTAPLIRFGFFSVVTIHDLSFFPLSKYYPRSRRLFKQIIHLSVKFSDRVIAVSDFTKNDILKHIGKYENKISVIYEAADTRFLNKPSNGQITRVKERYKIKKEYILFIGFLEPRKNLERLLSAYSMIKDDVDHDLVIVGGHGWWHEQTLLKVNELGIAERVVFTGYANDSELPLFYRGAAIFAFPSLYEGFGIAALESVFSDTPVLASNNTALPEILGPAAEYVDPYNTEEIASAMLRLLKSKEALSRLRENCAAVKTKYSWLKAAKETSELFNGLIAPSPRKARQCSQ